MEEEGPGGLLIGAHGRTSPDSGQRTHAPPVELLVLGMRAIIGRPHGQQHDVLACGLLKSQSHGNTAAFPGQVRLNAKHWGRREQKTGKLWGHQAGDLRGPTAQHL